MENKELALVGKHYLMKQAFGQDELHEREAVCTRGEEPQCSSHCPLHIDIRAVCGHAAKGNFQKAAAVIRTAAPFLHVLAENCQGECTGKCVLSGLGTGIQIRALEKACALYGGSGAVNPFMLPRKKKQSAVLGDGLFALACCWELGKKGYEVLWYTTRASMKEILMEWKVTEEEALADLTALKGLRITVRRQEGLEEGLTEEITGSAEVCCISPELGWEVRREGVYTGILREEAVWILASAKSTALLADRYLQGAAAADGRKEEGIHESRLFVTMDGVEGSSAAVDMEHITKESAMAEAARCIQCQCLECIKGCVYLQHYKRNPRGAIREIYNNLSIVMGNHMANGMINACDQCGQCKAACPNGFDYPDVCQIARHTMVETKKMPPSAHEFALLDQQFSNGEAFLAKPQPGFTECRYLFFPGCQASAVSPDTVKAAYEDLCGRLEGGVGLVLGCCGAIAKWAAREDLLHEAVERFHEAWRGMGSPVVICACPTCKKTLEELSDVTETVGIWEVLLHLGVEKTSEETVALHDACGARGDRDMQDSVREFVKALGCRMEEISFSRDLSPCCGYGGLVRYANREVAEKKAEFAAERTDRKILTYCMACRDQLARAGADTCHILELAYQVEPSPVPDLSRRRANRILLKQRLLREIWKEEPEVEKMLAVTYADGAEALMEDRMILKSDIDGVLRAYEESGNAVLDQEKGWLVTCQRIGNVTFWVKFTKTEDGYVVYGAYSHRMTVE
ncbi:MAG: 4Fe-4S dicluster domain-containing protein [Clostridiales bacterium]|nr:4Fe-4S dicluster domain-containing protein [Clostridiales bacterium]